MKINQRFNFVEGTFDTETGKLVCVASEKYAEVKLCFKENMNIPFTVIRLFSKDRLADAQAVFKDAQNLGEDMSLTLIVPVILVSLLKINVFKQSKYL